jgi:hypothetical protein
MLASWSPGILNSLHPDFSSRNAGYSGDDFFLVAEGPRRDIGGGLVRWQRTYAAVPATHYEPESYNYSFIGFVGRYYVAGSGLGVAVTGRPRKNWTVTSRVKHEYFLVGLTDPTEAAAQSTPQAVANYTGSALIPTVYALRYYSTSASNGTLGNEVDAITDPITVGQEGFSGGPTMSTAPSRTDYNLWMKFAQAVPFKVHVSYAVGDIVSYQGGVYACIVAISVSTTSTLPTNGSYWSVCGYSGFSGDVVNSSQWYGPWLGNSNGVSYAFGDQVIYLGVAYQCVNAPGAQPNDFPNTPGSTVWSVIHPSQFVAEDSQLTRWMGNIFLRQTRYVLAR